MSGYKLDRQAAERVVNDKNHAQNRGQAKEKATTIFRTLGERVEDRRGRTSPIVRVLAYPQYGDRDLACPPWRLWLSGSRSLQPCQWSCGRFDKVIWVCPLQFAHHERLTCLVAQARVTKSQILVPEPGILIQSSSCCLVYMTSYLSPSNWCRLLLVQPDSRVPLNESKIDLVTQKLTDVRDLVLDHGRSLQTETPAEHPHILGQTHSLQHL